MKDDVASGWLFMSYRSRIREALDCSLTEPLVVKLVLIRFQLLWMFETVMGLNIDTVRKGPGDAITLCSSETSIPSYIRFPVRKAP